VRDHGPDTHILQRPRFVLRRTKTPRGSHHLWTFLLIRALRPKLEPPASNSLFPHPEQPHTRPRCRGRAAQAARTRKMCVSNVAAVPLPASALFPVFVPPRLVARAHRSARATIESPGSADIRHRSIRRWRSPGRLFSFPAARLLRCSFRQCSRYPRHRGVSMPLQTIETKLEVFLYPSPAGYGFSSVICAVRGPENTCFSSSAAHIKHCNQTCSVARRRRVYLPRPGD
jgi:hypothetical protein